MSQTNYTPIYLYNSGTATNTPLAANLGAGELAINYTDGKLFYKDNSAAIQVIGWKTTPTTAGGTGLTSYTAGDLPYYASGSALSKLGIGTANYVLTSIGSAPQYVAHSTLSVGSATNATNTANTDNTSSSATWYPTIVSSTTGNLPQTTSSTNLSFVPSTGALTSSSFVPSGSSAPTNGMYLRASNSLGFSTNSALSIAIFSSSGISIGNTVDPGASNLSVSGSVFSAFNSTYSSGIRQRSTYIGAITASGNSTITVLPSYYRGFIRTEIKVVAYNSTNGSAQSATATIISARSNNTLIEYGLSTPIYEQSLGNNDYRSGGYITLSIGTSGNDLTLTVTNTTASAQAAVCVFMTDYISTN